MPLENRGTFNLVNAAPGVSGFTQGNDNFANEQTPNASANGHYSGGNLYVLDGISITSNITGGTGNISPNSESLQEIALQTNTFSLDFAGGSGVTIEMTTKAGNNRFHGSGDYSFLNQDLQAYSLFVHQYTPFKTQYVSGTFGGPIFKDRTYFLRICREEGCTRSRGNKSVSSGRPGLCLLGHSKVSQHNRHRTLRQISREQRDANNRFAIRDPGLLGNLRNSRWRL